MDLRLNNKALSLVGLLALVLISACDMNGKKDSADKTSGEKNHTMYNPDLNEEVPPDELQDTLSNKAGTKQSPLSKFSYTWSDSKEIPPIVIIVDDFGQSSALVEEFANLPSEVVFAVLPDLPYTKKTGEIASQKGHEVLIHIPMQAESAAANPGAKYIKTSSTSEETEELINGFRQQLPMAIGANNHMGSAVTADRAVMTDVLKTLNSNKMFFVDSATTGKTVSPSLAHTLGYPALKRDIFLDVPDNSDATLAAKIESLKNYTNRNQPVVIITHCHNRAKLKALQDFITQIQSMGLRLTDLRTAKGLAI